MKNTYHPVTAINIPVECDCFCPCDPQGIYPRDIVAVRAYFVGRLDSYHVDFRDLVPFVEASKHNEHCNAIRIISHPILKTIKQMDLLRTNIPPDVFSHRGYEVLPPVRIEEEDDASADEDPMFFLPIWVNLLK